MKRVTENTVGAGSVMESQRLLAKRLGPVRSWMRAHPVGVNILLALANLLFVALLTLIMAVAGTSQTESNGGQGSFASDLNHLVVAVVVALLGILFTAAIFFREKWSFSLLLMTGIIDGVATFTSLASSVSGIVPMILLYTMASRTEIKRALVGFFVYLGITETASITSAILPTAAQRMMREARTSGTVEASAETYSTTLTWADAPYLVVIFLMSALFCTIIFLIGRSVYRSRMFEQAILASFVQNQKLATTEERNRIAREMHDVVAHSLTVMIALADGARIGAKKNPARSEEILKELSSTGHTALADMRKTLGVLRDPEAADAPLEPTGGGSNAENNLRELVASFAATGLPVTFTFEGQEIPGDSNLRLALYRMVQESLTNVLRYGKNVTRVEVRVHAQAHTVHLAVINNGTAGLSPAESMGSGKGIIGMKERAAFYRGSVEAGPNDVGGWTVRAVLHYADSPV